MIRQRGFTLVELVMVIVIASIVGAVSVQFIRYSSQSVIDTAGRQQLAASAAIINEQITRALRDALPGSIRATADNRCVEYMPVVAASTYTSLTTGSSTTAFQAVPYSTTQAINGYVSVYPLADNNLYDLSNPGAITTVSETLPAGNSVATGNPVSVALSPAHNFANASPVDRFYLSTTPVAICQQGNYLYRFSGYGFISNVANLVASLPANFANGREVLAFPLVANSLNFQISAATLVRNGVVTFQYQLQNSRNDDVLDSVQEVHIRNVP